MRGRLKQSSQASQAETNVAKITFDELLVQGREIPIASSSEFGI